MKPNSLSIIIPAFCEAVGIEATLAALALYRARGVEVIVVDGGSHDGTAQLAEPYATAVLAGPRGRARQMNTGAIRARGDVLLFLHADTQLPPDADQQILSSIRAGALWGRFDVRITGAPRMLRVVAALMNRRSRLTGIATGDQAIFVRCDTFHRIGGFPDQPLMEDIELSLRLRRLSRPDCLRTRVTTSGRRWESRGVWKTILLMWRLRWRYWRGESAEQLAEAYR
ncbi:MAG: TIGR04283 family arsenosugar biosynthesis glycosyltransferase [Gemmatimonadota bacterium]|nr:TIGR04283 family arsenosugar biosynthesis glycosyltransferase [Gemmatimonadota bacterium]